MHDEAAGEVRDIESRVPLWLGRAIETDICLLRQNEVVSDRA